jgi:hypothetical protein
MTLVIRIPLNFNDPNNEIPKIERDSLINRGTKFMHDFGNPYCYPAQVANVPNGTVFTNLVEGAATGVVENAFAGLTLDAKGGMYMPGSCHINLGNGYNLATDNHDFLFQMWVRIVAGYSTSAYQPIVSKGTSTQANQTQLYLDTGDNGLKFRIGSASTTQPAVSSEFGPVVLDKPYLISYGREGGYLKTLINKTQIAAFPFAGPMANVTANWLIGSGPWKGWVYRPMLEDLTVSGKTIAGQAEKEYNKSISKLS